ncbi:MAG: 2-dehydro-3-deoxygluconokinase [Rhodoferax sp.]|nr:2-dehydro-3-deoxygluconokinase [Rhodoferax sp.]
MKKTIDVVALGEAMIEFNQTHPGQPQFLQGFGGDTSNAVIAAARAGASAAYLTRVGQDSFGQALIDLWNGENVGTEMVERDPVHPTGIYFVTHGANGHEFSYLRAGSAASRMTPQWLASGVGDTIAAARVLHLSGISLAISPSACDTAFAAMRIAREAGTLVSFDSNLRLKLWPLDRARACMAQAVSMCDVFLPSMEDVTALVGISDPDEVADWGHAQGAPIVVLKLGGDGALISEGIGAANRRERIPGRKVQLVDATGAGDCFCGNLLAQLAKGTPVVQAARYANAAASIAVQGFGAVAPLPRQADVEAVL